MLSALRKWLCGSPVGWGTLGLNSHWAKLETMARWAMGIQSLLPSPQRTFSGIIAAGEWNASEFARFRCNAIDAASQARSRALPRSGVGPPFTVGRSGDSECQNPVHGVSRGSALAILAKTQLAEAEHRERP